MRVLLCVLLATVVIGAAGPTTVIPWLPDLTWNHMKVAVDTSEVLNGMTGPAYPPCVIPASIDSIFMAVDSGYADSVVVEWWAE